ncbi:hypothetical protein ACFPM0_18850 [Pseudonocardia sulfidoxydans]|uniref:hypothetical protein n=1 Tax=Pseudonocardia sulfidoxydans TaxID=54011 RepID=UPI0036107790
MKVLARLVPARRCSVCRRRFGRVDSCAVTRRTYVSRFGTGIELPDLMFAPLGDKPLRCNGCGVVHGRSHHAGCREARCLTCTERAADCGCRWSEEIT